MTRKNKNKSASNIKKNVTPQLSPTMYPVLNTQTSVSCIVSKCLHLVLLILRWGTVHHHTPRLSISCSSHLVLLISVSNFSSPCIFALPVFCLSCGSSERTSLSHQTASYEHFCQKTPLRFFPLNQLQIYDYNERPT